MPPKGRCRLWCTMLQGRGRRARAEAALKTLLPPPLMRWRLPSGSRGPLARHPASRARLVPRREKLGERKLAQVRPSAGWLQLEGAKAHHIFNAACRSLSSSVQQQEAAKARRQVRRAWQGPGHLRGSPLPAGRPFLALGTPPACCLIACMRRQGSSGRTAAVTGRAPRAAGRRWSGRWQLAEVLPNNSAQRLAPSRCCRHARPPSIPVQRSSTRTQRARRSAPLRALPTAPWQRPPARQACSLQLSCCLAAWVRHIMCCSAPHLVPPASAA